MAAALVAAGWQVCARNWRGGGGELDVVVEREGQLRVVEVKLRAVEDPLTDDAIPPSKRSRLRSAARAWLSARGEPDREVCFLVAWVDAKSGEIGWLDDAFDG